MTRITINIQKFIHNDIFENASIFLNNISSQNEINSITIMDIQDISKWIIPQQALIIGEFMKSVVTKDFIKKLSQKKVSCVITKKKYYKFVKNNEDYFSRYNIPVLIIEDKYSWSDVIVSYQNLIIEKQRKMLISSDKFQNLVFHYLKNQHSTRNLCSIIERVSDMSSAIMNQNFIIQDYSDNFPKKLLKVNYSKFINFSKLKPIGTDTNNNIKKGYYFTSSDKNKFWSIFVLPFKSTQEQNDYFIILDKENKHLLQPNVFSKINIMYQIFSLKKIFKKELNLNNFYWKNLIFQEMISVPSYSNEDINKYSSALNLENNSNYTIAILFNKKITDHSTSNTQKNNLFYFVNEYRKHNEDNLTNFFSYKDYWVILIKNKKNELHRITNQIKNTLAIVFPSLSFNLGISSTIKLNQLQKGMVEAEYALKFLISKNIKQKYTKQFYNNIGILNILTNNEGTINQKIINDLNNSIIIPLKLYDKKKKTSLLETLQIFFKNNFSQKETSSNLYIHINTLRARLEKIESVINLNLKESDDLLLVNLAIKIYQANLV